MRLLAVLVPVLHAGFAVSAGAQETRPPADTASRETPTRRQTVTAQHLQTAFGDQRARGLLERARSARLAQDSALTAYDVRTYQRLSVGLGVRRAGEKLLVRTENAARVQWSRKSGVWIEPTGRRAGAPMASGLEVSMDMVAATPIPYFPGRETLWSPLSDLRVVKDEVDENEMLHPLAVGAEAYYRYEVGDSISFSLPDGRVIGLRELRITARRPDWRAFVGSFWFDVERGSLVRAAYRMAAEMDIWKVIGEDARREAQEGVKKAGDDNVPLIVRAALGRATANISAITVEYGLHEGRFWLPKTHVAEGATTAGLLRVPMKFEERFRYESVNSDVAIPDVPTAASLGLEPTDTLYSGHLLIGTRAQRGGADSTPASREAYDDSVSNRLHALSDSLTAAADSATAAGDTALARRLQRRGRMARQTMLRVRARKDQCATGESHVSGLAVRQRGGLRVAVRMPCDTSRLSNSPDLPGSLYDDGEELFGTADRDELLKSLDMTLQPDWAPQPPTFRTGLDLVRYNRIEGLSVGGVARSELGLGYVAEATARIGTADLMPNGEISLARSNGRRTLRLGLFHRLAVVNDDWGTPLSFGASLANALYARDEGFYYRSWGAELGGIREAPALFGGAEFRWRLFAERQRSAGVEPNVQASLAHLVGRTSFEQNIDAVSLTALGVGSELGRTFGIDPRRLRLMTRARAEAALTHRSDSVETTGYGRLMADATGSRQFGAFAAALTAAAGFAAGDLPPQRAFHMGGLHTVRGQSARPAGAPGHPRVGDAFWLGRAELGRGVMGVRTVVFYDVGWAGEREDFTTPGRPMSGAGIGVSLLDGLLRTDLSRGIWPDQRWRLDFQLGSRF